MPSSSLRLIALIAAVLLTGARGGRAEAPESWDGPKLLERAVAAWRSRQDIADRVRYTVRGEQTILKGVKTEVVKSMAPSAYRGVEIPSENMVVPVPFTLSLDFERNLVRKEGAWCDFMIDSARFEKAYRIDVYDGEELQTFRPRELQENPAKYRAELTLKTMRSASFLLLVNQHPIFFAHGIISRAGGAIGPRRLRFPPDINELRAWAPGVLNSREMLLARTMPYGVNENGFTEYWIDLEKDGAIARCRRYSRGKIRVQLDIRHQRYLGEWLPKSWTLSSYHRGRLVGESHYEVEKIELDPTFSKEDFHFEPRSGMIVFNHETGAKIRKGEPGEPDIDVYATAAKALHRKDRFKVIALAGAAALAVASMGIFLWRRAG